MSHITPDLHTYRDRPSEGLNLSSDWVQAFKTKYVRYEGQHQCLWTFCGTEERIEGMREMDKLALLSHINVKLTTDRY